MRSHGTEHDQCLLSSLPYKRYICAIIYIARLLYIADLLLHERVSEKKSNLKLRIERERERERERELVKFG